MTTKKWSVVPFGVILIAFFLPFVTFSCEGTRLLTLTGFQLVTGTTVERPSWDLFGERQSQRTERINPDGRAIIAFGGALVGFLLSLPGLIGRVDVQRQEGAWTALRALLAVVILVSLLWIKASMVRLGL